MLRMDRQEAVVAEAAEAVGEVLYPAVQECPT